jgi:hypothetical protein
MEPPYSFGLSLDLNIIDISKRNFFGVSSWTFVIFTVIDQSQIIVMIIGGDASSLNWDVGRRWRKSRIPHALMQVNNVCLGE